MDFVHKFQCCESIHTQQINAKITFNNLTIDIIAYQTQLKFNYQHVIKQVKLAFGFV